MRLPLSLPIRANDRLNRSWSEMGLKSDLSP
jgi:hypothetical protein